MYYQYMFLYNILSMKFRWVRLSPFSLSSKPCTRFRRLWCRDILGGRKRCRGWVSTELHLKNLSSALSHRSSKLLKSPGQNPALMLRLMNACNRPLTSALAKPPPGLWGVRQLGYDRCAEDRVLNFLIHPIGSEGSEDRSENKTSSRHIYHFYTGRKMYK